MNYLHKKGKTIVENNGLAQIRKLKLVWSLQRNDKTEGDSECLEELKSKSEK